MKKLLSVLLSMGLAFSMTACAGSNPAPAETQTSTNTPETTTETKAETAEAPADTKAPEKPAEVVKIKAYTPTNLEAVPTKTLLEFEKNVEAKSSGRIDIEVFHSNQLGNDREALESTRMGTIDLILAGTGGYSNFYPKAKLLDLPFLFNSADDAYEAVNGEVGEKIFSDLQSVQLVYLATGDNGMRHISTSKTPVNTAADVKGLKFRVPEIDTYVDVWKAFGAVPTPLPLPELYMALQTGTVDGQDNAPYHTVANKIDDVQGYYSMINYMWMGLTMSMNQKKYDAIPDDLKQILKDEAKVAAKWSFDQIKIDNESAIKKMQDKGIEVNLTPDVDSFRTALGGADYYKKYEKETWYSQEIIDAMLALQK
ncbi:MAG: tripartite ATP-independent periplasmic transporter solute receptor, DctP family [Clostridia bacterium]|jgi:tripartite ATP-independent transporter DctP family solute receptor|nr:tripartite ATP-independent periplasmic transporter solute receptor, DctP family [Clostridia bacterium]